MRHLSMLALGAMLACGSGCAAVVLAAMGGAAYVGYEHFDGSYVGGTYEADYATTFSAVMSALDELKLTHQPVAATPPETTFDAMESNGGELTIIVKAISPSVTAVRVRNGFMGDDDDSDSLSKRVLDRVRDKLKK